MGKRKVILDCDSGHDDVITTMMAARHPAIGLLGITIVAGNQTLDETLVNGLNVCQKLRIQVPVYRGMPRSLMREQIVAGNIHGEGGLDGPVLRPLTCKEGKIHAIQYITETLMASDRDITLIPVRPLTNIAVSMRMEPAITPKVRETVLMSGVYGTGDFTPSVEFNIFVDPEATRVVFTSGVSLVMTGLDLTNQTVCTPGIISRMESVGSATGQLFSGIMNFTLKTQSENYGLPGGSMHGATCIGYLIDPGCIKTRDVFVEIDVNNEPCCGHTVRGELGVLGHTPNVRIGISIDTGWFWDLVGGYIKMYG